MPKPRNMIDSFMAGIMKEAKTAVDGVTKHEEKPTSIIPITHAKKDHDHSRTGAGSYQEHIKIKSGLDQDQDQLKNISLSAQDQDSIIKGSDKEQVNNSYVSDIYQVKGSLKEHHEDDTPKSHKSISKGAPTISLSKSQTRILFWFKERGETGVFNKPEIERALSMPYITIRKGIDKLQNAGILILRYDGCQKIYEYEISQKKNYKPSLNIGIGSGSYQDQNIIVSPPLISSSSLLKETTTIPKIKALIDDNPEMGFWRQKGLTPKQIATWSKEFSISIESIIEALCYCRFDMVENERETKESIKDVFNWFYRVIEKAGTYPKPANYKSHAEKELERAKARVEETKRQAEELRKLRDEAISAQHDLEFEQMMQEPEGEIYKQCLEKLPAILKKPNRIGSISFINGMRNAFLEAKQSAAEVI